MSYMDKYLHAIFSTDLRDDATHHQTDALAAAALADASARDIGSLLARVKYADTLSHQFEDGNGNLARLQREWLAIVTEKGSARRWIKAQDVPFIGHLAPALYKRVADASLAHYLDGKCWPCGGTGVAEGRKLCVPCKGSGDAAITGLGNLDTKYAMDMVGELMALESSHSARASILLRRDK